MIPKKVNIFFDRSFQHGILANPVLGASQGFLLINRLVPELLRICAIGLSEDPLSAFKSQQTEIDQIQPTDLRDAVRQVFEQMWDNDGFDGISRIEVVISLHCRELHGLVKFFKKSSTNFWLWEVVSTPRGEFTLCSVTGQTD